MRKLIDTIEDPRTATEEKVSTAFFTLMIVIKILILTSKWPVLPAVITFATMYGQPLGIFILSFAGIWLVTYLFLILLLHAIYWLLGREP